MAFDYWPLLFPRLRGFGVWVLAFGFFLLMSLQGKTNADPGLLDRRVILQYALLPRDAVGGAISSWLTSATVWAGKRFLSGSRLFAAEAKHYEADLIYRIRHRSDVVPGYRLVHGTSTFEVVATEEVGREQFLDLTCRKLDAPTAASTSAQTGSLNLTAGQYQNIAATFPITFGAAPAVVDAWVTKKVGGAALAAFVNRDAVSTTGFTVDLAAPVPDDAASGDYVLNWFVLGTAGSQAASGVPQSGSLNLAADDYTAIAATFTSAYTGAPSSVRIWLTKLAGAAPIEVFLNRDAVTAVGFTADLAAPIPTGTATGDYRLHWLVLL